MSHPVEGTRASLLDRLREGPDPQDWARFDALYRDLLVRFCRSRGLQQADAEDAVQTVFGRLVGVLQRFQYDPARGRFRDYLYRCARSVVFESTRRPKPDAIDVDGVEEPVADDPDLERSFEQEWVSHHYRRAIHALTSNLEPRSIEVFEALLAGGEIRAVAERFQLSEAAVYKIQQRVRERLRDRIHEQVREEDRVEW